MSALRRPLDVFAKWWRRGKNLLQGVQLSPRMQGVGFDNPRAKESDDRLDRVRLAQHVYALLVDLPRDYSVRVGLLGEWGTGKTTIANWIAQRSTENGHIVISFNPWAARTLDDLWAAFGTAFLAAVEQAGIRLEATQKLRDTLTTKQWTKVGAEFAKPLYAPPGTIGYVSSLLAVDPADFGRSGDELEERRLVVLIDDLDRTDPKLLPQLLLALRDVLDLPGFSFLLPFDQTVVTSALKNYNPAWGDGDKFLEKILDYLIFLPSPTAQQRKELLEEQRAQHCPFVPKDALDGLEEVLPPNPRRLKAIIRGIGVLRDQSGRHAQGEIDWRTIIFALLLRAESEKFFDTYVAETFEARREVDRWLSVAVGGDKEVKAEETRLEAILEKAGVADPKARERLKLLCGKWRALNGLRNSSRVRYALGLLHHQSSISSNDFDEVVVAWTGSSQVATLADCIRGLSSKAHRPPQHLVVEFVQSILSEYNQRLDRAANATLLAEHEALMAKATPLRAMFTHLLLDGIPELLMPEEARNHILKGLLDLHLRWIQFRANSLDAQARRDERASIITSLNAASVGELIAFDVVIDAALDNLFENELGRAFLLELYDLRSAQRLEFVVARFDPVDGINALIPYDAHPALKALLLDEASAFWARHGSSVGEAKLREAKSNPIVQRNAIELIHLILAAIRNGHPTLENTTIRRLFTVPTIVGSIWSAAIASELQFRKLLDTRQLRQQLIASGADPTVLPEPLGFW